MCNTITGTTRNLTDHWYDIVPVPLLSYTLWDVTCSNYALAPAVRMKSDARAHCCPTRSVWSNARLQRTSVVDGANPAVDFAVAAAQLVSEVEGCAGYASRSVQMPSSDAIRVDNQLTRIQRPENDMTAKVANIQWMQVSGPEHGSSPERILDEDATTAWFRHHCRAAYCKKPN